MFRSHLVHVQQSGYRVYVHVPLIPLPVVTQEHGAEVRPQGSNREYRKELAVERGIKNRACMGGKQKSRVLGREKEKDDVKRGR